MCYYNGVRVTRKDYLRLMAQEKEIKKLRLWRPAQSGFDYRDWPIIKPTGDKKDFVINEVHWEYIPDTIVDETQLFEMRTRITTLNAKAENLFSGFWNEGATNGRCLVLSSGFYEWRHIPKYGKKGQPLKATDKIPYHITLRNKPEEVFYIAGISKMWTNEKREQSADTFAIITTEANELMDVIHNTKKRMPTILPESLAKEWLYGDLSKQQIQELARYQIDYSEMTAWPVQKNFIEKENPEEEFEYENLPEL